MSVQCEKHIPAVSGLKDQELTVGRHLIFKCTGNWDKSFDFPQAAVKLDENLKHSVKVLKAEARNLDSFDVDVVFYSAGEFKFPDFILTDGKIELPLGEQNIKIETVIEKPADGKPPEPFGPIFPYKLSWPAVYLMILVGIISLIVVMGLWLLNRRLHYRKLVKGLKDYDSSIDPDLQFYKSVRAAEINGYNLDELEKAFRLYILRAFQIPAFDLSDRQLLSFFKSSYPWLKKERLEMKKMLEEFKSTDKNSSDVEASRKLLVKKMYRFVDQAEAVLKKVKR